MRPYLPSNNSANSADGYRVESRKLWGMEFSGIIQSSYLNYIGFRKFGVPVLVASRSHSAIFLSAFSPHIQDIVQLTSEKFVIRPDAWRIIAGMAHLYLIGYRSVYKLISYSVSKFRSIRGVRAPSVSIRISGTSPEPASLTLGDSLPKPSFRPAWISTLPRTVLESLCLSWNDLKWFFAGKTDKRHSVGQDSSVAFMTAETLCWINCRELGMT